MMVSQTTEKKQPLSPTAKIFSSRRAPEQTASPGNSTGSQDADSPILPSSSLQGKDLTSLPEGLAML